MRAAGPFMSTASRLRLRRSAAQLHALTHVEREIRAADPYGRRKYLREFNDAFQAYEAVLDRQSYEQMLLAADFVLVGDYHALPKSQQFAAEVVERIAASGRQVVLGLECVFSRDQHILDDWQRGVTGERELRERLRFDTAWGYDWQPFYRLLTRARQAGALLYGLDATARGDLRRISIRDRHAAERVGVIHASHPEAAVVVLFGESHLAPQHLPALIRARVPRFDVLTVLQNVDALYWQAAGEPGEPVRTVRVRPGVVCAFTATPLEKYESYRHCIERWKQERRGGPDYRPSFHGLIDALAMFLNFDVFSASTNSLTSCLYDTLPEVCSRGSIEQLRRVLKRRRASDEEVRAALGRLQRGGCAYVQRFNLLLVAQYDLASAAEEAARFVQTLQRGDVGKPPRELLSCEDRFYAACMDRAAAYVGSRILCPTRDAWHESDLFAEYARVADDDAPAPEAARMLDFVVLHRDYECNARRYREVPELIVEGRHYSGEAFELATGWLGRLLGTQIYEAFLAGKLHKRYLRALLSRRFSRSAEAKTAYFKVARRTRANRNQPLA